MGHIVKNKQGVSRNEGWELFSFLILSMQAVRKMRLVFFYSPDSKADKLSSCYAFLGPVIASPPPTSINSSHQPVFTTHLPLPLCLSQCHSFLPPGDIFANILSARSRVLSDKTNRHSPPSQIHASIHQNTVAAAVKGSGFIRRIRQSHCPTSV